MEFRTDNLLLFINPDYFPHLALGLVLLIAAGFCRGWWFEGWGTWTRIFEQAKPSLESNPSPVDQAAMGFGGLLAAVVNAPLTIVFTVLALDQLIFMGRWWEALVEWLLRLLFV